MSYQVLARKWRPRDFRSLGGQEHIVRALRHALEQKRLHHAYLFTGTRGVGKTTLARILAKCLNCETGITPQPGGKCPGFCGVSGARGRRKTTLAPILAKCLNCETGIPPQPCGKCSACVEIDGGRFVALLEVGAGTNHKGDEMRQRA